MKQTNNHVKNYKPKVRKSHIERTVPLRHCITKFGVPKSPTIKQTMILEWIAKWS